MKWARSNPKPSGYQNPGWPGCCRPPTPQEQRLIPAADWPAVTLVHHVPTPPDIKAILESLTGQRAPGIGPVTPSRGSASPPSQPATLSRRTGTTATPANRIDTTPPKNAPLISPTRNRGGGGSPQQLATSLASRGTGSDDGAPSTANASAIDQISSPRRPSVEAQVERRRDSSREAKHSPGRKPAELSGTLSRKGSTSKPSISAPAPSTFVAKAPLETLSQNRRVLTSHNNVPSQPNTLPASRLIDREKDRGSVTVQPVRRRRPSLNEALAAMSVSGESSASSSDSGGSETTIISDGGFTDYLSDESEAELQRQAELKAALLAQTYVEEQEFRAARQQLANVDLRPPKSWTGNPNSSPRPPNPVSSNFDVPYPSQQLSSSSQSRG